MLVFLAFALMVLAHFSDGGTPNRAETELPKVMIARADGVVVPLRVEVADSAERVTCGLMHRESLPDDQGMLFVHEGFGGFWNRNTLIPLSVAYLSADGHIIDIIDMEATAFPGAPGVTQPNPREPYSYVIEVNRGWFDRNGIVLGDLVDVAEAVARGSADQPPPLCRERGT